MKNSKGFTLIELLVTMTLMLSLLGMAIVSFINVSDMRKEEAYRLVKEQIITAAESYFENNSYYKENLSSNGNFITVSLGKLVEEDYLNIVVNPATRKKISKCSYVKLIKEDNHLKSEFVNYDEEECLLNSFINVVNVPSKGPVPTIEAEVENEGSSLNKDTGWYIKEAPVIKISATNSDNIMFSLDKGKNYESLETEFEKTESEQGKLVAHDDISYSLSTTKEGRTVTYKATNENGNFVTTELTLKVDLVPPRCKIDVVGREVSVNTYEVFELPLGTSAPVYVKINYYDNIEVDKSEIKKPAKESYESYSNPLGVKYPQYDTNNKSVSWSGKATDIAGNVGTCNKDIKVNKVSLISEALDNTYYTKCGETTGEGTSWTNKTRTVTQCFDKVFLTKKTESAGCVSKDFTTTTTVGTIEKQGVSCKVDVYVDKEKPYFSKLNFDTSTVFCKSNCDGIITLLQWENNGKQLADEFVELKKNNDGYYEGYACLSLKTYGKFGFREYSYDAADDDSGVYKLQSSNKVISASGKDITGHCYPNESPCLWKDIRYAYDKAGNKSDNFGKLLIHVGYKNRTSWCK